MATIVIKNADWVIAWDEAAGTHVYRRDIDVVFTDQTIVFVGRDYPGAADRVSLQVATDDFDFGKLGHLLLFLFTLGSNRFL